MQETLSYNSVSDRTVGVEVEVQILDADTLRFTDLAPDVLRDLPLEMCDRLKEEFIRCMVELNTPICNNIDEVSTDLIASIKYLQNRLAPLNAVTYFSSLHPLERGDGENLTEGARYRRIMDELQIVGRRFITQGLHVHTGVKDPETAISIVNTMRMYLPMLLALSTSSPYYQGEDTGMYSYRTQLFDALPLAGMPNMVEGWQGFSRMVGLLKEGGVIETPRDLWWDVRPNTEFGTVEVRICDMPTRFEDIIAIAALTQATVCMLMEPTTHPEGRLDTQILRANKWNAARYGLEALFIDPVDASRLSMIDAIEGLLHSVAPSMRRLGSDALMENIRHIIKRGTGAHRQRELYRQTGDFTHMINTLREEFLS